MSCQIDVDYEGEDSGAKIYSKRLKARKTHKCSECGCDIPSGAEYEAVKWVYNGVIDTFRTCIGCLRIRDEYFCSWCYGCLRDDFIEYFGFDYAAIDDDDDLEEVENPLDPAQ